MRELYSIVCRLEEEKYDWEDKIRKQDFEVGALYVRLGSDISSIVK